MTIKFKVVYKNTKGNYSTMHFRNLRSAETFAQDMDGIVLYA